MHRHGNHQQKDADGAEDHKFRHSDTGSDQQRDHAENAERHAKNDRKTVTVFIGLFSFFHNTLHTVGQSDLFPFQIFIGRELHSV